MGWYTTPFLFGTCYAPITTPLVYSEDLSIAQQIAHLFGLFNEHRSLIDAKLDKTTFEAFLDWLDQEQLAQSDALKGYTDVEISRLKKYVDNLNFETFQKLLDMINELIASAKIWNVTKGRFDNSIDAMRDLFHSVTIRAMDVEQLDGSDYTVESIVDTGLTVNGLATMSGLLHDDDFIAVVNGAWSPKIVTTLDEIRASIQANTDLISQKDSEYKVEIDSIDARIETIEDSITDIGTWDELYNGWVRYPNTNSTFPIVVEYNSSMKQLRLTTSFQGFNTSAQANFVSYDIEFSSPIEMSVENQLATMCMFFDEGASRAIFTAFNAIITPTKLNIHWFLSGAMSAAARTVKTIVYL